MVVFFIVLMVVSVYGSWNWLYSSQFWQQSIFTVLENDCIFRGFYGGRSLWFLTAMAVFFAIFIAVSLYISWRWLNVSQIWRQYVFKVLGNSCIYNFDSGGCSLLFLMMAVFFTILTADDLYGSWKWLYFSWFWGRSGFTVLDDGCIFCNFDGCQSLQFFIMAVLFAILLVVSLYGSWHLFFTIWLIHVISPLT